MRRIGLIVTLVAAGCAVHQAVARPALQPGQTPREAAYDPPWTYPDDLPPVPASPPPPPTPVAAPHPAPVVATAPVAAARVASAPHRRVVAGPIPSSGGFNQLGICEESGANNPTFGYYGIEPSTLHSVVGVPGLAGQYSQAQQQGFVLRINHGRVPFAPAGCAAAGYRGW